MPDAEHGPVTLQDLEGRNFARPWEVASVLGADVRTIRAAIRRGEIPATTIGPEYYVPLAWLRQAAGAAA